MVKSSFLSRSILVLFTLTLIALSGAAIAQDDTTLKPLPDFLKDRPIPPSQPAIAQETYKGPDLAPEEEKRVNRSDLSDIPDEYIIEASKFGEECRNDRKMPLYFDCRCVAVRYLDTRIELGPESTPSAVRNQLGAACKDGTGIAGQLYERCLLDINNAPTHLDPEEFCSCYGNTFAKYFEDFDQVMGTKAEISLKSKARLTCQDPVTARRIYGAPRP